MPLTATLLQKRGENVKISNKIRKTVGGRRIFRSTEGLAESLNSRFLLSKKVRAASFTMGCVVFVAVEREIKSRHIYSGQQVYICIYTCWPLISATPATFSSVFLQRDKTLAPGEQLIPSLGARRGGLIRTSLYVLGSVKNNPNPSVL